MTPLRRGRHGRALVGATAIAAGIMVLALLVGGAGDHSWPPNGPTTGRPVAGSPVTIAQPGPGPELQVSWSDPAGSGGLRARTGVTLYRMDGPGPTQVAAWECGGCTSTVFYYLVPGRRYQATVTVAGRAGRSARTGSSPVVQLVDRCPQSVCVTVDATDPVGVADHAAQGILHSAYGGADQAYLRGLHVSMYRGAVPYGADGRLDWSQFEAAEAAGTPTTLLVSDAWRAANHGRPPAPTPSSLVDYARWLQSYVQALEASGHRIDYWEPFNEPGAGYYTPEVAKTVTAAELYNWFLISYRVIKSLDPTARIIGPSMSEYVPYPHADYDDGFNMSDFLDFAAAHHLVLAAVSWHDNSEVPLALAATAAEARQMIALRPELGRPALFVNEYGGAAVQRIPGWDVAFLQAITTSRVAEAGRSCWAGDCWQPDLDGLLSPDGIRPLPDYYVRSFYGQMTGDMVDTSSTSDNVTSVASYDPPEGRIDILVGRGVGHTDPARRLPRERGPAPPADVTVRLVVPWPIGAVSVTETDISGAAIVPYRPDRPLAPASLPITPRAGGKGVVTVEVPAFADGDAWTFAIRHLPQ